MQFYIVIYSAVINVISLYVPKHENFDSDFENHQSETN
jgi:hypothetical protein